MKTVMATIRALEANSGHGLMRVLTGQASELLKEVLLATYNPYVTYGIKEIHEVPTRTVTFTVSWERWKNTFARLANRSLSGNAARDLVAEELASTDPEWREIIRRVIARDLKCGINVTSINKVFPGLIPTFNVSLAKSLESKRIIYPCTVETKKDGKRVIAVCKVDQEPILYSRNGHVEHSYQHIRTQLRRLVTEDIREDRIFDGELMFGMFGSRKAQEASAEFVIFDWLHTDEWEKQDCRRTWGERADGLTNLKILLGEEESADRYQHLDVTDHRLAHDWGDIDMAYRDVIDNGGEGVMVKNLKDPYMFKRGYHWMKLKPEESEDLTVTGYFEGEGKYQRMLGGIEVDFNGVTVRVGSGFSDAERKKWWDHVENRPVTTLDGEVALLGKTAEVLYTEVTPDGSLRFPRFKCWRNDK